MGYFQISYTQHQSYPELSQVVLDDITKNTLVNANDEQRICGNRDDNNALQDVIQGVMNEHHPIQFMDAINAGSSQMGNRAFLQFVNRLYQEHQTGDIQDIAAKGLQGPGKPMTYLDRIQQAFGHHDVSNMREHIGSAARDSLNTLNARGYSSNGRMAFHGTPDLYTEAHEAAHGVQQAALETRLQFKGGIGEAGDKYEQHADAVAKKVVRGESAEELLDQIAIDPTTVEASSSSNGPVQMMHLISVGGGPRGVTQVNEEVDFLAKHKRDLEAIKKLGGKYDIRTTIIEKQEANALGRGAAWTEQNQGTVNTGSEGGYHDRLSTYYQTNKSAIEQELQSHSVGLSTFTSAFTEGKSGKPVTHRASTTRAIQGREELQHFQRQQERAEEFKDFYRLEVLTDTQVTSIDLSDTIHPAVDTKAGRYDADTIRLNTGTTVAPPVRDEGVLNILTSVPCIQAGLETFYRERGYLMRLEC